MKKSLLYQNQDNLPKLPIPPLSSIRDKLKSHLQPILNDSDLLNSMKSFDKFITNEGINLMDRLEKYAEDEDNYLYKFWLNGYLKCKDSLLLNVNPIFIFEDDPTPARKNQISRASSLLLSCFKFVSAVKTKNLTPDIWRQTPLCMNQFKYIFGTARVPTRTEKDTVKTYEKSRHIVVIHKNRFYTFDVLDPQYFAYLTEREISQALQKIVNDEGENDASNTEAEIGLFTARSRTSWADIRRRMMPKNKNFFKTVDSALFILCLDDFDTNPIDPSDTVSSGLCGKVNGKPVSSNRWYDKLQLIVSKNGQVSVNFEHSSVDGHTVLRFVSDVFTDTIIRFAKTISGSRINNFLLSTDDDTSATFNRREAKTVRRVKYFVDQDIRDQARFSREIIEDNVSTLNVATLEFTGYGKNFITRFRMSPDAFVQVSLLATFYSLYGEIPNAYESVLTKTFKLGRTGVARSSSMEALSFCQKFYKRFDTDVKDSSLLQSLQSALREHSARTKLAAKGQCVDRLLFAIAKLQDKLGFETSEFFDSVGYKTLCKNVLSTSNCGNPSLRFFGFGPVTPDGLGVGYVIKEESLNFCVTGYKRRTCSFVRTLEKYLNDVHDLITKLDPTDFEKDIEKIQLMRQTSDVYDFYGETNGG